MYLPSARMAGRSVDTLRRALARWSPRSIVSARRILSILERVGGSDTADTVGFWADRALRRARGTPWLQTPHFEVTHGTWGGVLRVHDVHGRLLGEGQGIPWHGKSHPTIQLQPAPFPGSRHGRPYNATALRQMAKDWPQVLRLISEFRAAFLSFHGVHPSRPLKTGELWGLASVVTAYPAFMLRRAQYPWADHSIPSEVASAFKVMAGVSSSLEYMVTRGSGPAALDQQIGVDALYEYIEQNGLFNSGEGRTCGGPERLIREVLRLSIEGPREALSYRSELVAVVEYGLVALAIELLFALLEAVERRNAELLASLADRRTVITAAAHFAADDAMIRILEPVVTGDAQQGLEALIEALNGLSVRARDALGRADVSGRLTTGDLDFRRDEWARLAS